MVGGKVIWESRKTNVPPWRPVPIGRLRGKLALASEYCENIVAWGNQEFCRPVLGDTARKWSTDYRDYYRSQP